MSGDSIDERLEVLRELKQRRDKALGCLLTLLVLPFALIARACVVNILWGWFVTPQFDIPSPGVVACIGLAIFAMTFYPRHQSNRDKDENPIEEWYKWAGLCFLMPALSLLFGWIVHLLM